MCLLLFAYRCHPQYPLLLLANRDEFFARPSAPTAQWRENGVVAGRDLQAGGTWLGIATGGRVAAVTNVREPNRAAPKAALSRGNIPHDFLISQTSPSETAAALAGEHYRGFNALLFDFNSATKLVCAGNRHTPFALALGVHGISNGAPDAPWPKVVYGKAELAELCAGLPAQLTDANFVQPALALLRNSHRAARDQLPTTGVGTALERALSSIFVCIEEADGLPPTGQNPTPISDLTTGYGTRASTLVAVDKHGDTQLWEQNYAHGRACGLLRHFSL